jgi:hypothetical protein
MSDDKDVLEADLDHRANVDYEVEKRRMGEYLAFP